MKDKVSTVLISIKTNEQIVKLLKSSKKLNLPYLTLWITRKGDKSSIDYALLVNKSQFKQAVVRNNIKRQLRNILMSSNLKGGIQILIKPNATYLKKEYSQIQDQLINTISKYQNGK